MAVLCYAQAKTGNYSQKLGGNKISDYKDAYGFLSSEEDRNSKLYKKLKSDAIYSSYEEHYANLMPIPDLTEIDTREEMAYFVTYICNAHMEASLLTESHEDTKNARQIINDAMMENAKKAARGLPYDTQIHFDPNKDAYMALINRVKNPYNSLYAEGQDIVIYQDAKNDEELSWLVDMINGGINRIVYNQFYSIILPACRDWYNSEECRQVQEIEDELIARARAEKIRKTPEWFVEGRKKELEIVTEYNRKNLAKLMKIIEPKVNEKKALLSLFIKADTEVDDLRANGKFSMDYVNAKVTTYGAVEVAFTSYYMWMSYLGSLPLVRTPVVPKVGERFLFY
ncbi:MAG: hypothetical protein K6G52_05665 [Treponemataceae bacterium]|nr:hypothetical protein [Treponemataceae bacterium]